MTDGFFGSFGDSLAAASGEELRSLLDMVDTTVLRRTEGRRPEHRERYCIVHYLRTLARNGLIPFPFRITKHESPDFDVEVGADLFDDDEQLSLALQRLIEIIGEAAKNVSDETRARAGAVPWPKVAGMRDRLIHPYFDVDLDILWTTVVEDLPRLRVALDSLLAPKPPSEP